MGNVGPTQARYEVLPVPAETGGVAAPIDEPGAIAGARDRTAPDNAREPQSENAPDQHH